MKNKEKEDLLEDIRSTIEEAIKGQGKKITESMLMIAGLVFRIDHTQNAIIHILRRNNLINDKELLNLAEIVKKSAESIKEI